jgi:hypothetical protein
MLKKAGVVLMALALFTAFGYGSAWAQDPTVDVTRGGLGDGLLFDLYDVRPEDTLRSANWQNYFVIENTSGNWTAVHLRFRSWKKSIEVWDHVILLSPRDVFWAVIQRATEAGTTSDGDAYAEGDVIIWSTDEETINNSGLVYGATEWTDAFRTDLLVECGYDDDQTEIQAGYVEVIGLWQLSVPLYYQLGWEDTHDITKIVGNLYSEYLGTDYINVYDLLEAGWAAWSSPSVAVQTWPAGAVIGDGAAEFGTDNFTRTFMDCGNILAGSLERGDLDTGRYEMGNFVALQDFRTQTTEVSIETSNIHRDGSWLGAIMFPAQMLPRRWVPFNEPKPNPYNVGLGGQYMPPALRLGDAPYVNESYSSTIGPGWRDGDDSWQNNAPCPVGLTGIARHNNIWSLDDVEAVLQPGNLWNHYYNAHNGVDYWSDLVLTFPTKHYHWLFATFPWWNDGGLATRCFGNPAPLYDNDSFDWEEYLTRVLAFRGSVADDLEYDFDNGRIGAFRLIWNMEQDLPVPGPPQPSPRPPQFDPWIPHEVNIISVGDDTSRPGYNTGIHEGDPVLTTAYGDGQFTIGPFWLKKGDRNIGWDAAPGHPIYGYVNPYQDSLYLLPPIMEIIFTHAYTGFDVAIRSTCTPVKFDQVYELDGPFWTNP